MLSVILNIILLIAFVNLIIFFIKEGPAFVAGVTLKLALLPFTPFIVAYRIKKEKPGMSKTLLILWSLVYLVIGFSILLHLKTL